MLIVEFKKIFKSICFDFSDEKKVQQQIEKKLIELNKSHTREHRFDKNNIPDFLIGGLCVEVKIKGSKKDIYKQLERYAKYDVVKSIILITNRAMVLPSKILNKPVQILSMGNAWL